ncbi:toxin VasX [Jannaschia aquimarina]|uniref:Toxin VasX N-terminal region domain-containing protein n=1 Tax=Jannaschia aquimarina TaxID=935700 RepID=A0A0D1EIY3_9RHOB|nr:toxin VasX [Jannaschia aquimarina]KIT16876.1 hypothetical protein jaqu_13740 [Jannaschia aquimarina]SNT12541.1 hypothetical protein SAMN05421775_10674 [Jannaschia aquimarina]
MTFSTTDEAGQGVSPCDPSIIPIYPMRFGLTGNAIEAMLKGSRAPMPPQTIPSVQPAGQKDHELLRLRQGFVYILADNHVENATSPDLRWQIWRYVTSPEDDNSSVLREDTATRGTLTGYTFTKYEWEDGTVEGPWVLESSARNFTYAYVSAQVSRVWVAYSEDRWPSWFFHKAAADAAFRNRLMTEVNVHAPDGQTAVRLRELASVSRAFAPEDTSQTAGSSTAFDFDNIMRQTGADQVPLRNVGDCLNAWENGLVVAVHDPVGEHLDMAHTLMMYEQTKQNFLAEYQYPIKIKECVEQVRIMEDADPGIIFNRGGFDESILDPAYGSQMSAIETTLARMSEEQEQLVANIARMEERTGKGTMMELLTLLEEEAANHSGPYGNELLAASLAVCARCAAKLGASPVGSDHLLAKVRGEGGQPGLKFLDAMARLKDFLQAGQEWHDAMLPAINAAMTFYGREMAQSFADGSSSPQVRSVIEEMFSFDLGRHASVDSLSTEFQRVMNQEWTDVRPAHLTLRPSTGVTQTARLFLTASDAAERPGMVTFWVDIEIRPDSASVNNMRTARSFDAAANGLGLMAAMLSLFTTATGYGATPNRNITRAGRAVQDPLVQLIAGFSDAFSSAYNLRTLSPVRERAASALARARLFGNAKNLSNAVRIQSARGTVAVGGMKLFVRCLGIIGVAISGAMMVEGYQRADTRMMVGNAMMAIAGIALLAATGIGAIIALAVLLVGFILTLMGNSDAEAWVATSFWGRSPRYWGVQRASLPERLEVARVLGDPAHAGYESIRREFDEELARFIDVFSSLEIKTGARGDGILEFHSNALRSTGDVARLRIEVGYDNDWSMQRERPATLGRLRFVRTGVAAVTVSPPPNPNGSLHFDIVRVEATLGRTVGDDSFEASETFSPSEI